jgi:hypothetical protein
MYPMKKYKPVSLKKVKTYSIKNRKSKVMLSALAEPHAKGGTFSAFLNGLPDILAASDFKAVVDAVVSACRFNKTVVLGMGAHPIKAGLSPVIIDLMRKGVINAVAANGACIIHDFELSYIGKTSEDVGKELAAGTFGMAEETGRYLNKAIRNGLNKGLGIGKAVGEMICASTFPHKDKSIFGAAFELGIPATVHIAVGTDIIHMHSNADGAAIGKGSFMDFKLITGVVSDLEGGVYINLGSAVILPEVFLKALTIARNLGNIVESFTTVNMDFIQHYRPCMNVLRRPAIKSGNAYALTGHHEIMFPLLAAAILEQLG